MRGLISFRCLLAWSAASLWVRDEEEDAGRGAKEEGSLLIKGALLNLGAARELGSLGKVSRDSFLNSPKDRTL